MTLGGGHRLGTHPRHPDDRGPQEQQGDARPACGTGLDRGCNPPLRPARALGKRRGTYVTLDLRALSPEDPAYTERAALALRDELRALLEGTVDTALVVGLGNRAMTPDVIGPRAADHVPATRHLKGCAAFGALADVSVLTPGVLGTTGLEAAELVRGAVGTVRPDLVVAVDALASQSLGRVCTTVQLTDAGIVPGSGVGNHRRALTRETLGVPVLAVGVPTVVDAATLTCDVLAEAGKGELNPAALQGAGDGLIVTPKDIDSQVGDLSKIIGYAIDLALQPGLTIEELELLLS